MTQSVAAIPTDAGGCDLGTWPVAIQQHPRLGLPVRDECLATHGRHAQLPRGELGEQRCGRTRFSGATRVSCAIYALSQLFDARAQANIDELAQR